MKPLDKELLLKNFHRNEPVTHASIRQFEIDTSIRLPDDYGQFLEGANGGEGFIGPNAYVILWRLEELQGLNEAYQVALYAPGLFLFGSDGGGEAFAFDMRSSSKPIVSVPFVGMELGEVQSCAENFSAFLENLFKS